jgi:uncharacterized repeat protein (TIGR04076 family)
LEPIPSHVLPVGAYPSACWPPPKDLALSWARPRSQADGKEDDMKRREFLVSSSVGLGAGLATLTATGLTTDTKQPPPPQAAPPSTQQPQVARPRYEFEVDIVEGQCGPHKTGQKIKYPDEKGKICAWLMDAMSGAVRVLEYGGTLPWLYKGTPYEKVIDPNGITTEFIRCPDPSRVVVAKITRRRV